MENLVEIQYAQSGQSCATNEMGMREMQAMVYAQRHRRHLLVKAPPASGKSRAMMFVALDKLANQGVRKVVVAVPEKSIGRSFNNTKLSQYGFFADWAVAPYFNLCNAAGSESSKREKLREFLLQSDAKVLLCTHSTLRNAMKDPQRQVERRILRHRRVPSHLGRCEQQSWRVDSPSAQRNDRAHFGNDGQLFPRRCSPRDAPRR